MADAAVVISTEATQNMSCANGVCAPTATKAVLNVGDLETMLASGNATVTTTGSGVQAKDIEIKAAVSWSTGSGLTLDAYRSATIDQPVSVQGQAALTLITNDGGSNGVLTFGKNGNVTFANLSSVLTINGTSYTLENSIQSLATAIAANPSGAYALANSYDASQDGMYSAAPISTTFSGNFEGLGNTISKLSIDDAATFQYVALFAQLGEAGVGQNGLIENIRLDSVQIVASAGSLVGSLVGVSYGELYGDSASGKISLKNPDDRSGAAVGGLAGDTNGGPIGSSFAAVQVSSRGLYDYVGGLAGGVAYSSISKSHATGSVAGHGAVGGLVGLLNTSTTDQSYANGSVTLYGGSAGDGAGGMVGLAIGATISDSYATGNVTKMKRQASNVGGFVGDAVSSNVASSYSTGAPSGSELSNVGGFLGNNDQSSMQKAYWDTTTSGTDVGVGQGRDAGLKGLTTQKFQSGLPKGFRPTVWGETASINGGFPYLLANPPGTK